MLATVGNTHKVEDGGASEWLDSEWVLVARKYVEDEMDVDMEDLEELGIVMNYATGKEVERRIAFPGTRVELTPTEGPFSFQKVFGDSDFFAAGVMKVPVGGRKPNKHSRGNTYNLYCDSENELFAIAWTLIYARSSLASMSFSDQWR
ncbi:hypothetical protein FRC08_014844 [Ceratobasidium sp. 394]|nr:hypothetical protein FRC08_014844 [Ceratobasidium sp. 394]